MSNSLCGRCQGGYVITGEGKASLCPQCESISIWENSGIRDSFLRFSDARLDDIRPPFNKRVDFKKHPDLDLWISGDPRELLKQGKGLSFFGAPDSGKTYLLVAIIRRLIFEYQVKVKLFKSQHLVEQVRNFRSKDPDYYRDDLVKIPLILWDDLATEDKIYYPYTFSYLDDRYSMNLPTFFTGNIPPEHFANYYGPLYGPRIISRVLRMNDSVVEVVGHASRKTK